jgi:hypothetical protein
MNRDLSTLEYILDALADREARRNGWTTWTDSQSTGTDSQATGTDSQATGTDSQATHRWLVPSWDRLAAATEAAGVGFFGQLRPRGADRFPSHLERRVAETAAEQGWLLAYLNVCLGAGPVYANLVVVTERSAVHALAGDAAHSEAVARAPAMYESIRIHRLALSGPPASRPPIEILETLSIDYRTSPPRREVRVS